MTGRRIAYGGFLIGALLLQILYDGYWGGFLFLLALALPVLSLLLTLPLLFQGQLQVLPSQEHLQRGKEGQWELHFQSRFPLILPGLRLQMAERNELTGETRRFQVLLLGPQMGELGQIPMTNQQCGCLTCVIHRAALLDCLGLFALPVGHTGSAYAWVDPVPAAVPPLDFHGSTAYGEYPQLARTLPGFADPQEELRPYRGGDPLRWIHWKLSSKWDEWIVREPQMQTGGEVTVTFDHRGPYEEFEKVLDELVAVARQILENHYVCRIQWFHPQDRTLQDWSVTNEEQLQHCMEEVLAQPCPLDQEEQPSWIEDPWHIHIPRGEVAL